MHGAPVCAPSRHHTLTGKQVHDEVQLAAVHKPLVQLDDTGMLQALYHVHLPFTQGMGQG